MRRAVPAMLAVLLIGCSASVRLPAPIQTPSPEVSAFGLGPQGSTVEAEVVGVVDGDTIHVRVDGRVQSLRYIGIDSPGRGFPGARAATSANAALVGVGVVTLERDVSETDRFGRLLRYVWIRQGNDWLMVNKALVRRGHAVAKAYPPDTKYQSLFEHAQKQARSEKLSIWADGLIHPLVPPAWTPRPGGRNCDPSYPGVCIQPPPPDLDCGDISFRDFRVRAPDPHHFDAEGDGIGCETY